VPAKALAALLGIVAYCLFGQRVLATDAIKIKASDCLLEPKERALSGFVLSSTHGVVTALHGVADCRLIIAMQPAKEISLEMRVSRQSIYKDLALLDVVASKDAAKLARITSFEAVSFDRIGAGAHVTVIGYPHGVLTPQYNRLSIGYPKIERLGDIVGTGNLDLVERKSPNMDLRVIKVSGLVVKGESGAPVVLGSETPRVVGVVIGSTNPGASNIAWAVPIAPIEWSAYSIADWQGKTLPNALANAVGVSEASGSHRYQLVLSTPGQPDVRISLALGQSGAAVERLTPAVGSEESVQQMVTIVDEVTGLVVGSAPLGNSIRVTDAAESSTHEINTASAAQRVAVGIIHRPNPPTNVHVN
jgi:hypothetical protein